MTCPRYNCGPKPAGALVYALGNWRDKLSLCSSGGGGGASFGHGHERNEDNHARSPTRLWDWRGTGDDLGRNCFAWTKLVPNLLRFASHCFGRKIGQNCFEKCAQDVSGATRGRAATLRTRRYSKLFDTYTRVQIFVPTSATHLQSDDLDWDWA